jgi:hypothetical protein
MFGHVAKILKALHNGFYESHIFSNYLLQSWGFCMESPLKMKCVTCV